MAHKQDRTYLQHIRGGCCLLLILLWSYAGAVKLANHEHTLVSLQRQVFTPGMAFWLSVLLPATELVIAALLVRTRFAGLLLSAGLMTVFTIYISLVINGFFSHSPCSCGGLFERFSWRQHLLFNLFILLINILALGLTLFSAERKPHYPNRREVNGT